MQFSSRFMSNPTLSDNDFKNKMDWFWTTLNSCEVIKVILML